MAFKIFLDANIVLDFTLQRDIGYDHAKRIIQNVVNRKFSAYITPAIVHISGYYLTKARKAETAKEILLSLLADISTIDMPHATILLALHSNILDIEDSLQYYSAMHHNLDYFISRDEPLLKFHNPNKLPVIHPKDFVEQFIDSM